MGRGYAEPLISSHPRDNASRLQSVGDGTNTATYSYLANSPLVEKISFTRTGTTNMVTSKAFDYINRLTAISSVPSASSAVSSSYGYNDANQRTTLTNNAGAFWSFGYDTLGQVTSGRRKWADGTHVAGQQFEYSFDDIGNRKYAAAGGDQAGANLRTNNYTANLLNQYSQRDYAGYVDVQGSAATNATVTVNNQSTYRKDQFYRKELQFTNTSTAVNTGITNVAVISGGGPMGEDIVTTQTGTKFLPQTPESFTYDSDGNLTSDVRWTNLWNGENRLVQMESTASAVSVGAANLRLNFDYDSQGRRIRKQVAHWSASQWQTTNDLRFVYDGWNLVAEYDGTNVVRSYTWGTDLSGSMQGAGGVGGLLAMRVHNGPNAGEYVFAYDGNGNVIALVNTATGVEAARYEYSPFGQLLQATGPMAFENKFRFSTKYCDDETGFYYYGFRFFDPDTGRWLSRDPLQEITSVNLYSSLNNDCQNSIDILGLASNETCIQSGLPFTSGATWSGPLGSVSVDIGFNFTMQSKDCAKCCGDGRRIIDHEFAVTASASGTLTASTWGASWGWVRPDEAIVASIWSGLQASASGTGTASGVFATDKCNGINIPQGQLCLGFSITGAISGGGAASVDYKRRVLGRWVTIFSGNISAVVTGSATISVSRCWTPNSGWGPTTVCSQLGLTGTLNLAFISISRTAAFQQCAQF